MIDTLLKCPHACLYCIRKPGCPFASGMEARQGGDVEQAPSEGRQPARTPTPSQDHPNE